MTSLEIGFTGLSVLIVLMACRVPVGLALGLVGFFGTAAIRGFPAAFGILRTMPYDFVSHWSLTAIPMFLLMGAIAYHTGMTSHLFTAIRLFVARLPGGPLPFTRTGHGTRNGPILYICSDRRRSDPWFLRPRQPVS